MEDINNKKLNIGDEVVYAYKSFGDVKLKQGKITKIYANDKECTVDSVAHIYGYRIMKIKE